MSETAARDRHFYSIPKQENLSSQVENKDNDSFLAYIRNNVIGKNKQFSGPFGLREALYLDYTASGKSLKFIEDYIQECVLPEYGNTHTTTSVTSLQTTLFRHEARDIVRNAVHASEHDAVIFVGSGSTGAVHKLIHGLNLKEAPIVIVGPYEHHSNLLPWKEVGAKVIRVKSTPEGLIDLDHLEELLKRLADSGRKLIGCFSAASNITGILTDVDAVTVLLHKHGALAFWDYATAAPYVKLDMNPVSASMENSVDQDEMAPIRALSSWSTLISNIANNEDQPFMYKDAVFLSCHKFVGGVQTPGVLIAKKKLFQNSVPGGCGGGSVFFVRRDSHRYLQEPELKEEGGTPAIVEAVRAGLVFQLKQAVTAEVIMDREDHMLSRARDAWRDHPSLILLSNLDAPRLPIFSFLVHHAQSGLFLHHNYVSSLLNDLFGIQSRGGCACAGPYAMDLLGLEEQVSKSFEELLAEDSRLDRTHLRRYREYSQREIIRPGFTRINLPYFMSDEELEFVLEAVKMVAEEGWKLLPQYMFNPETGEWRQKNFQVFKDRKWLGHISYNNGEMSYKVPQPVVKGPLPTDFKDCLQKAKDLFAQASKTRHQLADHTVMFDEESKSLRWFLLPSEASSCLQGNLSQHASKLPFCPPNLRERLGLPVFKENSQGVGADSVLSDFHDRYCTGEKYMNKDSDVNQEISLKEVKRKNAENDISEIVVKEMFSAGMKRCLDNGFVNTESGENSSDKESSIQESDVSKDYKANMSDDKSIVKNGSDDQMFNVIENTATKDCDRTKAVVEKSEEKSVDSVVNNSDCEMKVSRDECKKVLSASEIQRHLEPSCTQLSMCNKTECKSDEKNSDVESSENHTSKLTCEMRVGDIRKNKDSQECPVACVLDKRKRPADMTSPEGQQKKAKDGSGDKSTCDNVTKVTKDSKKKRDNKWFSPPKTIFAPFLKAMEEHVMIKDGDKVLVCLSGGKDSLSLLHTIRQYQFYCRKQKIKFELGAVTVDPETESYDPSPLKPYLASLGVPYFYESQGILEQASNLPYECASICSFCSRMKRGRIYACARREGYNVLALGQHLDDLCESFLMSIFHNGILRTMKAHYTVEEGDLRVIRPLVYVREKDLRMFAEKNHLPVIAENCPACFEVPKERHRVKQLLAAQEIMFPRIFPSMMSAIKPIMAINRTQTKLADLLTQGTNGEQDVDDMEI